MTQREGELRRAVAKAYKRLAEAIEWCPDHYGAKADLEKALALVDNFRCWFEQTHA